MGTIQTMDIGPEGDVFVVNRLGDIQVRDGEEWSWVVPSLPQMNDVQLLKIGADGDIWGATDEGVSFFNRSSSLWTVWKQPGVDARNDILEIVRARDGSVWIGTGGGVEVRKPDGTIEWTDQIEDTAVTSVTAVAEDERGNIWIGSGNAFPGAFRWDGQRWQHFGVAEGLPVSAIHKIRTDSRGRLWFLGLDLRSGLPLSVADGPGAFLYTDDQFVRWGQEEGLPSGRVYAFAEAPDGAYWFGTLGGLSRWARGVWTHWTVAEGLVRNRIFALAVDPEGTVWFSHQTSGNGLGFPESQIQTRYRLDAGAWSNWTTGRQAQLREPPAGTHSFTVQAKGWFGTFNANGSQLQFNLPPPLIQRPVFYAPIALLSLSVVILGTLLLTRKSRHDAALRRAEMERRKLRSLGALVGGIAHDFNNLFAVVLGHANLARTDLPPDSPLQALVEEIENAAKRGGGLTDQMLIYSGKAKLALEHVDLAAVVEETVGQFETRRRTASFLSVPAATIKVILEHGLDGQSTAVEGDVTQIRQVAMNLLMNASEAMSDAGGVVTVQTGVMEVDDNYLAQTHLPGDVAAGWYAFLEVADTGCGMDPDTMAQMFDPFFSTKFLGRGLGLSAVLGMVRGHNGAIKIDSKTGTGTKARVLLPATQNTGSGGSATP